MLFVLALAGCDQIGGGSRNRAADSARDFETERLSERVDHLDNQMLDVTLRTHAVAYLSPQDHDFVSIQSDVGLLTVSVENVTDYADGSRVRLKFGNPTSASIVRFSFHVSYGRGQFGNADDRGQDFTFSETLSAGTWHTLNIDLAGVPPNQLGHLSVSQFGAERISLSTR